MHEDSNNIIMLAMITAIKSPCNMGYLISFTTTTHMMIKYKII